MADGEAGKTERQAAMDSFLERTGPDLPVLEANWALAIGAPWQVLVPDRFVVEETRTGPRACFDFEGGAYAVRFVGCVTGPYTHDAWQWLVVLASGRELEIERADVDATPLEMEQAQEAVLDAELALRGES